MKLGRLLVAMMVTIGVASQGVRSQVGKSIGLIDMNTATMEQILALPNMTPEIAKSIQDARPFDSVLVLNKHLLGQKLTQDQINQIYSKAFVHINLNSASKEEIMLIPGAGKKMAHEFEEYRPWKSWAQFDKEIGKYVGKEETSRLAQYCFIPISANKAGLEELTTIPSLKGASATAIIKGRPWKSIDDLKKELAKAEGDREASRLTRYLVAEP